MPKVIDHDRRRAEIGAAAQDALVDEGWSGVTLRGIAARTGWSTGSVRHYFPDQRTLRSYVAAATTASLRARVAERLRAPRGDAPVIDQVATAVEELLPLDDERHHEYWLWVALAAREREHPDEDSPIWDGQRELYRRCVAVLTGKQDTILHDPDPPLDARHEAWAAYLHAVVDGLASQIVQTPARVSVDSARALVRGFLAEAADA